MQQLFSYLIIPIITYYNAISMDDISKYYKFIIYTYYNMFLITCCVHIFKLFEVKKKIIILCFFLEHSIEFKLCLIDVKS